MIRWLNVSGADPKEESVDLLPDRDLQVTASGRVPGRELYEVIREKLPKVAAAIPPLPNLPYETKRTILDGKGDTAVVVVETVDAPGDRSRQIAEHGVTVLSLNPRGLPLARYPQLSGDWATNERAWLIGLNLPLMRAADIAAAARELRARPGIRRVLVHAAGVAGWWAIYAAAHEQAIDKVWVDRTPHSIRAAFDQPAHYDLHDVVIPGVVPEARPSSKLLWSDPTDWMRNTIKLSGGYVYRNVIVDDDSERLIREFLR
jgi:hypothetical protein